MTVSSKSRGVLCVVLAAVVFAAGVLLPSEAGAADPPPLPGNVGMVQAPLSTVQGTLWPTPGWIEVCWENPTAANQAGRALTQQAVEDTWERVSGVDFQYWNECPATGGDIRIEIADAGARVQALGTGLDGMDNGMRLNFTFLNWTPADCNTANDCIRAIAVHEFGHALGFAHEQNRDDTPASCTDAPQGATPDVLVTPWDQDSIMNYCRPTGTRNWTLSASDVAGVRSLYGPWDDDTPFTVNVSGAVGSQRFTDTVQGTSGLSGDIPIIGSATSKVTAFCGETAWVDVYTSLFVNPYSTYQSGGVHAFLYSGSGCGQGADLDNYVDYAQGGFWITLDDVQLQITGTLAPWSVDVTLSRSMPTLDSATSSAMAALASTTAFSDKTCKELPVTIEAIPGQPVFASEFDDVILGTGGADEIHGLGGNDTVCGLGGNDVIYGDAGNDNLDGQSEHDYVYGGDGNDVLKGNAGHDVLRGEAGDDKLWGWEGTDSLWGGPGNDRLEGEAGNDRLYGDDGDDKLNGGTGDDLLAGKAGYDICKSYDGLDNTKHGCEVIKTA